MRQGAQARARCHACNCELDTLNTSHHHHHTGRRATLHARPKKWYFVAGVVSIQAKLRGGRSAKCVVEWWAPLFFFGSGPVCKQSAPTTTQHELRPTTHNSAHTAPRRGTVQSRCMQRGECSMQTCWVHGWSTVCFAPRHHTWPCANRSGRASQPKCAWGKHPQRTHAQFDNAYEKKQGARMGARPWWAGKQQGRMAAHACARARRPNAAALQQPPAAVSRKRGSDGRHSKQHARALTHNCFSAHARLSLKPGCPCTRRQGIVRAF